MKKSYVKRGINRRDFMKTTAVAGAALVVPSFGPFINTDESKDVYFSTLADALNQLPNAFPRTQSNIEILLLKKIFSPEEAWLAGQMTVHMEKIETISERINLPVEEVRKRLAELSNKGMVWGSAANGVYRLAPFIVGIYEAQLWKMDHELAHLVEDYFDEGGAEFMRHRPAIHRVVPAQSAVKSEWILPYDDVKAVLNASQSFKVRDCICRTQQDQLGNRTCDLPLRVCLNFTTFQRPESERDITREEALALLDMTEKTGLVHSVSNIAEGYHYVCNCCGCCCGILRGITEWGIDDSIAAANYFAVVDPGQCKGCGVCVERCQIGAISLKGGLSVVDTDRCIGCGLCATGCPFGAASLMKKPEEMIVHPPKDFNVWENERLKNRGLI